MGRALLFLGCALTGCYRAVWPCDTDAAGVCGDVRGTAGDDPGDRSDGPGGPATCAPQDVRGVGACDRTIGIYWTATGCGFVFGCECVGRDCGLTFNSPELCQAAHAMCR